MSTQAKMLVNHYMEDFIRFGYPTDSYNGRECVHGIHHLHGDTLCALSAYIICMVIPFVHYRHTSSAWWYPLCTINKAWVYTFVRWYNARIPFWQKIIFKRLCRLVFIFVILISTFFLFFRKNIFVDTVTRSPTTSAHPIRWSLHPRAIRLIVRPE